MEDQRVEEGSLGNEDLRKLGVHLLVLYLLGGGGVFEHHSFS